MAYNIDFIKQALAYKQAGHTLKQLREAYGIPAETYYVWKEKFENGHYEKEKPKQQRKRKIDKELLKRAVEERPDAYLKELAAQFNCTAAAVFYALEKIGMPQKNRPLRETHAEKTLGL